MDKRYEVYALADRYFYETPDRLTGEGRGERPATRRRGVRCPRAGGRPGSATG